MFNFVASSMRHSRVEFATLKFNVMKKDELEVHKDQLTLQFRGSLMPIVDGSQTVETRLIYTRNWHLYVTDGYYGNPIWYDRLKLINGRQPNAPYVVVEVTEIEMAAYTDENDKEITYVQDGVEYVKIAVLYHLGKILETNVKN